MDWPFAAQCLITLLAIVDPIGAVPYQFAAWPAAGVVEARRSVGRTALAVLLTLVLSMFVGQHLLGFFGISLGAFRAAGGLLLVVMAVSMLQGRTSPVKHTREEAEELADHASVAVVPLAIPILAGPGAITTVILLNHDAETWSRRLILLAAILVCSLTTYLVLGVAARLQDRLGTTGIHIANRLMGLILAAVGMQFMFDGARQLLPGLAP